MRLRLSFLSVLEGVLHLLAGLLEVGLALVLLAFGLEVAVVGRVSELLLGLAQGALAAVGDLVVGTHVSSSDRVLTAYPAGGERMRPPVTYDGLRDPAPL